MFNFIGLVSSGADSGDDPSQLGKERIAYHADRRLVAETEIDVADLVSAAAGVPEPLRVLELRARPSGQPFFIAWSDGADTTFELPWATGGACVTNPVPDAAGTFTESDAGAVGGRLSLQVGRDPLLVKPAP